MLLPSNLQTGRVEWRAVADIIDGDDPDTEPDIIPAQGEVWFDAEVSYWPSGTANSGPMTIVHVQKIAIIDSEGFLCSPDPRDPSKPGPNRFIRLFATNDPDYGVTGWKWKATPRLKDVNGKALRDAVPSKEFFLDAGTTLDLTHVFNKPLVGGPSTPLLQLEGAAGAAAGSARKAELSAAAAELEAGDAKESVYRAEAAVIGALSRVGADDAQVAGHIKDGTQTKAVVEGLVLRENQETVPPLVAQALAADRAPADAAAAAVSTAVGDLNLVESNDPRLPEMNNAAELGDEPLLAAITDLLGRLTWLSARASDGGPTNWALKVLMDRLGYDQIEENHSILFSVLDSMGRMSDLTVRASDGQLEDFVIDRLRERIGVNTVGGAQFASGDRHTRGGEVLPVMADTSRIVGWGSSSMQGAGPDLAGKMFPGVTFRNEGKSGETVSQIAARLGSIPALVTVPAGNIPAAKEAVAVTVPNITASASLKAFTGTLAGVPGTLAYTTAAGFTFTRTAAGGAATVEPGTAFVSTLGAQYRNAVTLLWMGKNDLFGTAGADQRVIDATDASYDWLAPLVRRTLVIGHFVNGKTPAVSAARNQILAVNAAHRRRYGDLYLDVQDYLTGPQVWADTGITPTAEDLAAQAIGNKPDSVSTDDGHLNAAGYAAVNDLKIARLKSLGWYS